jgi:hypothetical protein
VDQEVVMVANDSAVSGARSCMDANSLVEAHKQNANTGAEVRGRICDHQN